MTMDCSAGVTIRNSAWSRCVSSAGFSMVEMLLVLGALAILFGAIYSGFERLSRSYTAENVKAGTQQSVRIGVETMVQDMRLAGLNPLGTAGAAIVAAAPTSFQFTADVNFDGDLDDPFENITYVLNGTDLQQLNLNLDPNPVVLLENVTNLAFTYFDDTGAVIPTADLAARRQDIRTVGITLTVSRPAGRNQQVARTYTTQVRLRNM
jgi:type IV pilus assembly protein PilW